jgi:drug/metabolite transporter (DMT)-like permease
LHWGFIRIWTDPVLPWLLFIGLTLTIISIFSIVILLDRRENAYCVPLERAASLIAGVGGSVLLAWGWGLPMPRAAELAGAGILIAAVVLLSVAPRLSRRMVPARAETV